MLQGEQLCVAVFRTFGLHLTEIPLIATPPAHRRKGHARRLIDAFQGLLKPVSTPCQLCRELCGAILAAGSAACSRCYGWSFQKASPCRPRDQD